MTSNAHAVINDKSVIHKLTFHRSISCCCTFIFS
jgi:hypothetical protein